MPVINFTHQDVENLLGISITQKELVDLLPMLGSDIEDYDDENLKVEFFPNRPDHFSVEGVCRTLKGFLDIEKGLPIYSVSPSPFSITVDPDLAHIRPFTACCLVEGISLSEEKLVQLMEFQEDLHWVMGRDRKKVAIGIHNLDVLQGPFHYLAADPHETRFIPLDMDKEMSLEEILKEHKKGRKYAHLLAEHSKYPLIVDSKGQVLSMPPIINGELTKLSTETRNVLIDVTGTDLQAVNYTLNIIATSFAEAGGFIRSMQVIYPDNTMVTPDLQPKKRYLNVSNVEKIIGLKLDMEQVLDALRKNRLDARPEGEQVKVMIPAYRIDILHEMDLIENLVIGYGFGKIEPVLPAVPSIAREDPQRAYDHHLREIMIGLGFQEIMSLMLTSEDVHYKYMRLKEQERVQVAQPISQDRTMIRQSLMNGLLEFFQDNKHEDLPQKIFEIGEVLYLDETAETCTRGVKKMSGAIIHSQANFTEVKSTVASILANLNFEMVIKPLEHPSFIRGRCAEFKGEKENKLLVKGVFGELHPEVLSNFELEYPVVLWEMEFSPDNWKD